MIQYLTQFILTIPPLLVYMLVMLFLFLESTAIPIVNTTMLLFVGALASLGTLNFWVLGIVAVLGSTLGACSAYILGYKGGRPLLLKITSLFKIPEEKVQIAERWFQQSGPVMIFIARITPYIRPFACIPAGISRISFPIFLVAACSGSIVWCFGVLAIGWSMGTQWEQAAKLIDTYTIPALLGLVVLLAIVFSIKAFLQKRLERNLKKTFLEKNSEIA